MSKSSKGPRRVLVSRFKRWCGEGKEEPDAATEIPAKGKNGAVHRRSSFQLFKAEQVPAFLEKNPHVKRSDFSTVSKEMSKLWSALDLEEKERYNKLAAAQTTQNECAMPMSDIKSARKERSVDMSTRASSS